MDYAVEYVSQNPTWHAEDSPWKGRLVIDMLRGHGIDPASVCDVGCGAGGILAMLRAEFTTARVVGYDVAPDAIRLARERHADVEFVCGDATKANARYDIVLAIDVFEHVEDCIGFLRALRRLGQRAVFHVPLDISALSAIRNFPIYHWRTVGHLHSFTKDTALATIEHAGYRVVDWRYTRSGTEYMKSFRQKLAWLPRKLLFALQPDLSVRILGGSSLIVLAE
jgi:ubiquinone/menaquinone biosynthesis C-methylase UbiE